MPNDRRDRVPCPRCTKGSLQSGDDPDELVCFACGARVPVDTIVKNMLADMNSQAPDLSEMQPVSALRDTGDVTASMTAMLETSLAEMEGQLAKAEERRRQLKLGLRRGRVALRILGGEPGRAGWTKEARAAQAERRRKVIEGKRPNAYAGTDGE